MKKYIIILFLTLLFSIDDSESDSIIRNFINNGRINASVSSEDDNLMLVQINAINDSLLHLVNIAVSNLELFAGPSSYHRIINPHQFELLSNVLTDEYFYILNENYTYPNVRDYWVHTIHGDNYYGSSGEVGNTCYCLDTSGCVVVGFNDSWYDPFDYYGEAWWNFNPPPFDEIAEARVYVQGAQCDNLPVWSETDVSIRDNSCSWNNNFQVTLSLDYTLNGPYIIPDSELSNIWCEEGYLQPIIGSEDNYTVDFVRIELYYTCNLPDDVSSFQASNEEYCDYIELNWENNGNFQSSYSLYKDGEYMMQLSNEINQYLDYQADPYLEHQYCIYANNDCGQSDAICNYGKRKSPPSMVTNVTASDGIYQNEIIIVWDSLNEEDILYKLYRDGTQLSIISSNQDMIYSDQFVNPQIIYEYCIETINDCGSSDWNCDSGFLGIGDIGDINLDGTVDILDVVLLLNFILEIAIPDSDQIWLSDINTDGLINILDIIALVNIILR